MAKSETCVTCGERSYHRRVKDHIFKRRTRPEVKAARVARLPSHGGPDTWEGDARNAILLAVTEERYDDIAKLTDDLIALIHMDYADGTVVPIAAAQTESSRVAELEAALREIEQAANTWLHGEASSSRIVVQIGGIAERVLRSSTKKGE